MKKVLVLAVLCCFTLTCFAQNLTQERIRKISNTKKSVYLDRGIFHNGSVKTVSTIKALRHSFTVKDGFERIVFDFSTNQIPRIYGHFSSKDKKISIDFFDTSLDNTIKSFGKTRYVNEVKFFPASEESLSLEVSLKDAVNVDIFYLENPGRLVIDIKK